MPYRVGSVLPKCTDRIFRREVAAKDRRQIVVSRQGHNPSFVRLQVSADEEMVCGIDLVREQIRIAAGAALDYTQRQIGFSGHAIECRITAEDPATFMPTPGRVTAFHAPGGLGVRVDSALYAGYFVPPYYDSLVAKLIVHAPTRADAISRLRRALEEFAIVGIQTTIPLHQRIVEDVEFRRGDYTIHWLEEFVAR